MECGEMCGMRTMSTRVDCLTAPKRGRFDSQHEQSGSILWIVINEVQWFYFTNP
jgi:hypothetical protein